MQANLCYSRIPSLYRMDVGDVKGKGRRRRRGARRGRMPAAMDGEDEAVLAGVGE
jgi:hypothetical protein